MITYNDKGYPYRVLNILIDNEPTEVVVGVQSLSDAMGIKKEEHGTVEEDIDCDIYFYVDDKDITLPDDELALILDEPFVVTPKDKTIEFEN